MTILLAAPLSKDNPHFILVSQALTKQGLEVVPTRLKGLLPLLRSWYPNLQAKILHLHWLTSLWLSPKPYKSWFKSIQFWFELLILKALGVKIIWTVHNKHIHEGHQAVLDRLNTFIVSHLVDRFTVHCQQAIPYTLNTKPCSIVPHSSYLGWYPHTISRDQARKELKIKPKEKVILFLGNIRPYKGIEELLNSFLKLKSQNLKLAVAGWCLPDYEPTIREIIGDNPNVLFYPQRVPRDKIQDYYQTADIVALPFRDILNSGSLMLAFTFGKPVIAPQIGCVGELLTGQGGFPYSHKQKLGEILKVAINTPAEKLEQMGKHNLTIAEKLSPDNEASKLMQIYSKILNLKS